MSENITPLEMRWFVARGFEQDLADSRATPNSTPSLPFSPADRRATFARIADELARPGSAADRYLEALRVMAEHAWDVQWAALLLAEGDPHPEAEHGTLPDGNQAQEWAASGRPRAVRAWLAAKPEEPQALAGLLLALRDSLAELAAESKSLEQRSNRAIVEELRLHLFSGESLAPAELRTFYGAAARTVAGLIVQRAEQRLSQRHTSASDTAVAGQETTLELAGLAPLRTLQRERALDRLTAVEPRLSEIYLLATFAGRNPREIATLLDADPADVEADLETATVEVCLGEL